MSHVLAVGEYVEHSMYPATDGFFCTEIQFNRYGNWNYNTNSRNKTLVSVYFKDTKSAQRAIWADERCRAFPEHAVILLGYNEADGTCFGTDLPKRNGLMTAQPVLKDPPPEVKARYLELLKAALKNGWFDASAINADDPQIVASTVATVEMTKTPEAKEIVSVAKEIFVPKRGIYIGSIGNPKMTMCSNGSKRFECCIPVRNGVQGKDDFDSISCFGDMAEKMDRHLKVDTRHAIFLENGKPIPSHRKDTWTIKGRIQLD